MNDTELKDKARDLRIDVLRILAEAGSGHTAGPLGMADLFTALFFGGILKYRSFELDWEGRDRLVLSNGHICPILYTALAHAGYFPKEELLSLRELGTRLQGHPHRMANGKWQMANGNKFQLPGVEVTSGPLGQGFSVGAGMALALKTDLKTNHVYIVSSDGEHNEGQTWEAILFAAKYHLFNLTVLLDRNRIQISGNTEKVMPLESLANKYRAFNWEVKEVDGNNIEEVIRGVGEIRESQEQTQVPGVIICNTVPGKGVSFMENDYSWHGKTPNKEETEKAITEIVNG